MTRAIVVVGFLQIWSLGLAQTSPSEFNDARPPGLSGENWQWAPLNRWAFTHIREILPTKEILNSISDVEPIPGIESAAEDLVFELDGESVILSELMRRMYFDGVLVLKDGHAVVERYGGTLTPERTHIIWSATKTVASLTAASVAADGLIDLDDTVESYVPELSGSGWARNSLREVLDMRDSSSWIDDYDAPDSTLRRQDCAVGLLTGPRCSGQQPIGNYEFLPSIGFDENRSNEFSYNNGTADVLAWVLEAATGKRFADLVSERIWRRIGAERSAGITVDPSGFTLANGGMFATLRDMGRFGLLMVNRGRVGEQQVVPESWLNDIYERSGDADWPFNRQTGMNPYYRSFVWGFGDGRGSVRAEGAHGQLIYVAPASNTVVVVLSSWPEWNGGEPNVSFRVLRRIARAIETTIEQQ